MKGCSKRVIVIKTPESDLYEEAYFILKNSVRYSTLPSSTDMVSEANRLINGDKPGHQKPPTKQSNARKHYYLGFFFGMLSILLLYAMYQVIGMVF